MNTLARRQSPRFMPGARLKRSRLRPGVDQFWWRRLLLCLPLRLGRGVGLHTGAVASGLCLVVAGTFLSAVGVALGMGASLCASVRRSDVRRRRPFLFGRARAHWSLVTRPAWQRR